MVIGQRHTFHCSGDSPLGTLFNEIDRTVQAVSTNVFVLNGNVYFLLTHYVYHSLRLVVHMLYSDWSKLSMWAHEYSYTPGKGRSSMFSPLTCRVLCRVPFQLCPCVGSLLQTETRT